MPYDDLGMDAVVVSLPDSDYLYVVVARHDIVMGYKLCGPGNAIPIGRFIQQGEKTTNLPNNFPNKKGDETEKSHCYKNGTFYVDLFPAKILDQFCPV